MFVRDVTANKRVEIASLDGRDVFTMDCGAPAFHWVNLFKSLGKVDYQFDQPLNNSAVLHIRYDYENELLIMRDNGPKLPRSMYRANDHESITEEILADMLTENLGCNRTPLVTKTFVMGSLSTNGISVASFVRTILAIIWPSALTGSLLKINNESNELFWTTNPGCGETAG